MATEGTARAASLGIQDEAPELPVAKERRGLAAQTPIRAESHSSDRTRMLQAVLAATEEGRIRMFETYEGEVVEVGADSVVAVFEVGDDLVRQVYGREQFLDGKMPDKGERLAVYVHVATVPSKPDELVSPAISEAEENERPRRRTNTVPLPRTF